MFPDDTSSTTVSALTAPAPYTHTDVHYGHPRAGTEKVRARQRAKFYHRPSQEIPGNLPANFFARPRVSQERWGRRSAYRLDRRRLK